ncbi:TetR/AcrR family transcriptional regulator [Thermoflavimicrobium daqui]|jgi:AcrR family transcriptional regulator|uniref:TetR family transcriptional regulator n=1 Tax=Thermoflavimicrobium daqui TaxID=2137476 RepID=A0A364K4A9_9BACL|nr:TetR/AcrR family transcriptional regulator [Thermoflavimicrobium daqui]RAL24192.1 TetR family transcriptional regulator [Thermoflavimicrobium daqui]
MIQKKESKGEKTRARLLEVAAEEFAKRGFHETKVSTIVTRAGLTQPSFYLYFASKEAIFDELMASFRSQLHELVTKIRLSSIEEKNEVPNQVLKASETVFQFLAQNPNLTRIGFVLSPEADQLRAELVSLVTQNLLAEQQSGYFRDDLSMDFVAECMVAIIERLTISRLLPGIDNAKSLAKQLVNFIMYGMVSNTSAKSHS